MVPRAQRTTRVSAPSSVMLWWSLAARTRSWILACILLCLLACRAARTSPSAGDEGIDHGHASDNITVTAHNTDSSVGDSGASSMRAQSNGAASALLHHTAGRTRATGPPTCQELYAKRALSSSLLLSGDCVLPRISKQLSGDRRDDLLRRASSAEAATRIFTWHIGPRTPAHQAPLQSIFPNYFMNLSTAAAAATTADGARLANDAGGGAQGLLRADAATARRIHNYNALYSDEGRMAAGSTSLGGYRSTAAARSGARGSNAHAGKSRGDASSLASLMDSACAAVQLITSAAAHVVEMSGLGHYAQCAATEVIANLRVFAWRSVTAWVQLFMRRRVVVRIHIGLWRGATPTAAPAPAGDGGDSSGSRESAMLPPRLMLSRMAMLTHGSLSLLRVVSFPPVAQLVPDTPLPPSSPASNSSLQSAATSFVCSLPAVHAASLLLQEDAMARAREAQQAAAAAGEAAFSRRRPHRARPDPLPLLRPRLWMLSVVRNAAHLAGRLLSGTSRAGDAAEGSISANDGVSRSAAVTAARGFVARVREELGPHQSFGESLLPIALQQMLGSRTLHTHTQLIEEAEEDRVRFFVQWEASLQASTPMCLALAALPPSSLDVEVVGAGIAAQSLAAADNLPVLLEEMCSLDTVWLQLLFVAWVVWQLERRVAQNLLVHHLVTGLSGILLLLLLLLWYVIRRLQGTSFHLAMITMALLLGGSTAVMDGLLDVVRNIHSIVVYLSESAAGGGHGWDGTEGSGDANDAPSSSTFSALFALGGGALLLICVGSGILLNWLVPPAVLRATTFWCVRALLLTLWGLCVLRNAPATAVAALLWTLWQLRSLARIASCFTSPAESGKSRILISSEPLEKVPLDARQARGYVRPLAVSSWAATSDSNTTGYAGLLTSAARLKRYEEEGADCTRRALESLAAHLRANPGRYATRLRDPNGVQQWAGAASTETDEEAEG
ncbi:conserved hypothetical protein [Leishmania braziliensis MHOM/BR/75/M2904]|uniref:Uncharacterized protein n=1 Tax=Leishmania braziliensis TaxID=5660 RepID=A4HGI2_LEIBR|nr:conserved hypothetical protein [Leishmania braziliensis MHOM/BR/75/M2904]CAJ2465899.1 unnamed protein product [Leishmania braziliensis]CAM39675.1 conserved hypothetical protein [Leishmania braziliensis MHOM/BR/75/M2904]